MVDTCPMNDTRFEVLKEIDERLSLTNGEDFMYNLIKRIHNRDIIEERLDEIRGKMRRE